MNVDTYHDLGIDSLLQREMTSQKKAMGMDQQIYISKFLECFHSDDTYQQIQERVAESLI
jgi:hypothetical protein